jgi:riboflavin biosynthesis pyrimidine reductase
VLPSGRIPRPAPAAKENQDDHHQNRTRVRAEQSPESAAFAATWQAADKVVFSSTLAQVHTRHTRLERQLDAQVVAEIKAASRGDLTIGGPTLAAEALRLDLVDVVELLWCPAMLGGGIPVLSAGVRGI